MMVCAESQIPQIPHVWHTRDRRSTPSWSAPQWRHLRSTDGPSGGGGIVSVTEQPGQRWRLDAAGGVTA